jgi:hypothetical protein
MQDKYKLLIVTIISIFLLLCGIFFWPTLYRYEKAGQRLVRINCITGYTEILRGINGWYAVDEIYEQKPIEPLFKVDIKKIEISGFFSSDEKNKQNQYNAAIYNGSEFYIKKIKLSIGGKKSDGKIYWKKIYETTIDVSPYSKGSFSISIMDGIVDIGKLFEILDREKELKNKQGTKGKVKGGMYDDILAPDYVAKDLTPEVEIIEVSGCKGK